MQKVLYQYLCYTMQKVKNTIPVYDICSLNSEHHAHGNLVAEPFGAYLKIHPNLHLPHRHSFYHVVFFTKGKGFHTIDFENFDVRAGHIYFMIPGQVHSWSFTGEVDGYVINFSEDLFRSFLASDTYLEQYSFFRGVAQESVHQLKGSTYNEVNRLFENIVKEVSSKGLFAVDIIRTTLIQLFIAVQRNAVPVTTTNTPLQNHLILSNFRKLVDKHYAEKRLPKEYAALLYITPNHLNALSKDLLGKPAGELIRDRILLEAKRWLINVDKSIAEIALQLNFSDNSHFTKFFKKHTAQTPEEFRKAAVSNRKN
ncbi:MAG: AraC family transcriptional regulator [Flavipsychrobacter sp.]|nr:AraC family transcriptional regulator [Flavipsychrobacter sp.]